MATTLFDRMILNGGEGMIKEITGELARIESENGVKILYAVESGSRGWGFASKDSDYDVRFIYIRTLADYLSIEDHKDFIEVPINSLLDINGWDIRKALQLYKKSNPPLMEWLSSPIVYRDEHFLAEKLRTLSVDYFSPVPSLHHYLNLAKKTFKEMLITKDVRIKKYFYVLRPLMACRWIDTHKTMAPMDFHKLMAGLVVEADLRREIDLLMERKFVSTESDIEPINNRLYQYFKETIAHYEEKIRLVPREVNPQKATLDTLFCNLVKEVWDGHSNNQG